MEGHFRKLGVFVVVLLFTATFAIAQGIVTGSVSGAVQDPQGAMVSGATVTAKNLGTNQEFKIQTNTSGQYTLRGLPPGTYNVTIEAPNFRSAQITNTVVAVGRDSALGTTQLAVGAPTETVNVEGTAPLVESTTSQISTTFEAKKVSALPLGGSLDDVALFVPGVVATGNNDFSNTNGAGLSSNGQRGRSNNFQIDGQSNNDNSVAGPSIFFANQDALSEVQVITNYSAEYGRNMGSVVNYVTKSGTNAFHGSAFEIYRGSVFDSLTNAEKSPLFGFCLAGQTPAADGCNAIEVTKYVDNRFGGAVGGPIWKDRVWFYASSNEGRIRRGGSPSSSNPRITPTPNGINQLKALFPNSPGVQALAAIGPAAISAGKPTFSNLTTRTISSGAVSGPVEFGTITRFLVRATDDHESTGRVDAQITSKDRFFGRYVFQQGSDTNVTGRFPAGAVVDIPSRDQQIGLDWAHSFSNTLLNQVRFNYSRARFGFEAGTFPTCTQANIFECPTGVSFSSSSDLSFGMQNNLPQGRTINVTQTQDNVSWVKGKHNVKFGGEYAKQRSPNVFLPNINGTYTFSSFNSLVSNTPVQLSLTDGPKSFEFHEKDVAAYLQDDWRVMENLTLNLGMRWEWNQQAINLLHKLSVATQTGPTPFWDTTLPLSRTTVPSIPEDLNNFGPVVGFAWTPRTMEGLFGHEKTVVRGGFRIAYDPAFYNIFLNVATSTPTVNLATIITSVPGLPGGSSFTGSSIRAATLSAIPRGVDPGLRTWTTVDPKFHNPYSEQWNLGIQRQVSNRVAAEVRYVGNHTVGNFQTVNANPALNALIANGFSSVIPPGLVPCPISTAPGFGTGSTRGHIDCTHRNVLQRGNYAYSNYNGMQSRLDFQSWHGVTANFSYTWSKTIDNASEIFSFADASVVNIVQNPFNTNTGERGESLLSFPHVFGMALIYELPFFRNQSGIVGRVLGGWQLAMTHRYNSGQLWSPTQFKATQLCDSGNVLSSTIDACRPILGNSAAPLSAVGQITAISGGVPTVMNVGTGATTTLSDVHWIINDLNAAKFFGTPFAGTRRNPGTRGDTINQGNLTMSKNFKATERVGIQFRTTAYNWLNRQFRGTPDAFVDDVSTDASTNSFANTNLNDTGGGSGDLIASGIGRRRLEFGLRLTF